MLSIVNQLFLNATIIISSIMLAYMVLFDHLKIKSLKNSLINGFIAGVIGCILMMNSVALAPDIIIDFRYAPVLLMGLYVSPLAAIEASMLIGLFRIGNFGLSRITMIACIVVMIIGVGCGLIGVAKRPMKTKWALAVSLNCLIASTGIYLVISSLANWLSILLIYIASTIIVSSLIHYLIEYLAAFQRKLERLKDEAEKDFLTGLKNSRQFYKSLHKYFDVTSTEQKNISLLYMDVDHFKSVNDQFGHENGDIVLRDLGSIFKRVARSRDIISRKGGEEFAILLVDCTLLQAENAAERIRHAVETHDFKIKSHHVAKITISIGVSSITETTQSIEALIEQADAALYAAKRAGRNRIMVAG